MNKQTMLEFCKGTVEDLGGPLLAGKTLWVLWYDENHVSVQSYGSASCSIFHALSLTLGCL